jgi:hypothetical protein
MYETGRRDVRYPITATQGKLCAFRVAELKKCIIAPRYSLSGGSSGPNTAWGITLDWLGSLVSGDCCCEK